LEHTSTELAAQEDRAVRPAGDTTENTTPTPRRKAKTVRDKITGERGKVVRVYREGWLLAEMEDGTWSLYKPDEVELVMEGGR
jgi:membrane protein implicated in regulation of membrane protease activity